MTYLLMDHCGLYLLSIAEWVVKGCVRFAQDLMGSWGKNESNFQIGFLEIDHIATVQDRL